MEIYNKRICLSFAELCEGENPLLSLSNYRKLTQAGKMEVLRRACFGNCALVAWDSIPDRFRARWMERYGDPEVVMRKSMYRISYKESAEARKFYTNYLHNEEHLSDDEIERCVANASVMEQLERIVLNRKKERKMRGNTVGDVWATISGELEDLREITGHTLTSNVGTLRKMLSIYKKKGYESLINKKYGNSNAGKITLAGGRYLIALRRAVNPSYNTAEILALYNEMAEEKGWKPLKSESSVTGYLNQEWCKQLWMSAVEGELVAHQRYDRKQKTQLPIYRNSLWYGDGTKLNLFYKEYVPGTGWKLATLSVYEVMDAASEVFLGYHISKAENYEAQYRAFRMAVETAGERPYEIVVDNQGGHRKLQATGFFDKICAKKQHFTAPHNPQSKTIESAFGRIQKQILSKYLGFTGVNITSKRGGKINMELIEANVEHLPELRELKQEYAAAREKWNNAPHPSFKESRMQVYARSENPECTPVTDESRVAMFYELRPRAVLFTDCGLTMQVDGKKHTYEPLLADGTPDYDFRREYTHTRFFVKYDPLDLICIRLYKQNAAGELVFVANALPQTVVNRAMQDQRPGERSAIIAELERVKEARVYRELEAVEIEQEWGTDLEGRGCIRARIAGLSNKAFEKIADSYVKRAKEKKKAEKGLAAAHQKAMSNITPDQLRLPRVDKISQLMKL